MFNLRSKWWKLRWVLVGVVALAGGLGRGLGQSGLGPGGLGQGGLGASEPGATQGLAVPAGTAEGVLLEMASGAGVIFAGQVVSVTRAEESGYVEVSFRVDQAVRGCDQGGVYRVREWAGLWTGQAERYRVGQRLLMLLTAKGAGGMSAPVNGMDGAIPLLGNAAPALMRDGVVPPDTGVDGSAGLLANLRWVRARAVRGVGSGAAAGDSVRGQVSPSWAPVTGTPFQPINAWAGPIAPMPAGGPSGSGTSAEPSLSAVLALLAGQH